MREIDPQSEGRLSEALRCLAAASPRSAPVEVGNELLGEFRRHHARRRLMRRGGALVLVASLAVAALWLSRGPSPREPGQEDVSRAVTGADQKTVSSPAPLVAGGQTQEQKKSAKPHSQRHAVNAASRAFLALPAYDPSMPTDDLQVVRVQLPASALWKIGAPVPADASERRVMADFVVGQDGTAYAVRLVQ